MKNIISTAVIVLLIAMLSSCDHLSSQEKKAMQDTSPKIEIGLEGNAYITDTLPVVRPQRRRNDSGQSREYSQVMTPGRTVSVFFRVNAIGDMHVYLRGKAGKKAQLNVTVAEVSNTIRVDTVKSDIFAGTFKIEKEGYQRVDIFRPDTDTTNRVDFYELIVNGNAVNDQPINYVYDFSTHFGRRGPSTHIRHQLPEVPTEYFYSEVTIPKGNDVIGSYFMANGFGQGYFGIQVNSPTERRVLFSVWSPYVTDHPGEIPDDQKVVYLRRGENVRGSEFGGEGSGGQSFMVFPWKVETTYRFLTRIRPDGKGNTEYTGYFYDPDSDEWLLLACFRRPKTNTYYTNAYSFLENFSTNTGWITRKGYYGNQWAYGTDKQWRELTEVTFTYDATARAEKRMDYKGGLDGDKFFMQNCGFFDDNTPLNSKFTRPAKGIAPVIDFDALEKIPGVPVTNKENAGRRGRR
ncbi:MAG: DUF3472 domain-containing protein [Bacteroidales bacterium]|jgi:hypothetical protein|nr:DUF3472 domain-containing protein [Bacteroidales bacterium]